MVAAWDDQEHNRRIIAQDGAGVVPDRMVAGLVRGMTGEILISPQPMPGRECLQICAKSESRVWAFSRKQV